MAGARDIDKWHRPSPQGTWPSKRETNLWTINNSSTNISASEIIEDSQGVLVEEGCLRVWGRAWGWEEVGREGMCV